MRGAVRSAWVFVSILCSGSAVSAADFGLAVLRGGGTRDFWVYDIRGARWEILPSAPHSVATGGCITFLHQTSSIYVLRGGGTRDFWRFTPDFQRRGGTWTVLAPAPGVVQAGASLVGINFGSPPESEGIYTLQGGGSRATWHYHPDTDTWTAAADLTQDVGPGGAITAVNSTPGLLQALAGGGSRAYCGHWFDFGMWSCADELPAGAGAGASLSHEHNRCVFGLLGGGTRVFFAQGSWCTPPTVHRLTDTPAPVGPGGGIAAARGLVGAPVDTVYAIRGDGTRDFWRYIVATDRWQSLPPAPAAIGNGGGIVQVVGVHGELPPLPVQPHTWTDVKDRWRSDRRR